MTEHSVVVFLKINISLFIPVDIKWCSVNDRGYV